MCENLKVGSELVLEKPKWAYVKESKSKVWFPWHFEKLKTEIKQPQFFKCLINKGVILMIKFYITDGYVYDRLWLVTSTKAL